MSSTFTCRGCLCSFVDDANLKHHLNAFPVCKKKKSPSSSSSNAVVAFNPSKGKSSSSNAVVAFNPKAPSNAVVASKNVSSTIALMNRVCNAALPGSNLQPVGTPGTNTVFSMQVAQQVPVAVSKPKTVKKKINKQVMFVIDESGSMSGSKFNEAMNGCKTVLKSLNSDHDWVGIYLFDTRTRCVQNPVFLRKHGVSNLEATINGLRCNGGGTAIYDAVMTASNAFVKPESEGLAVQYELIVLTDGADGGSKRASNRSVNAHLNALKASGGLGTLHVTVLAVGMSDRDRNEMRTMVNGLGEVHDVSSSSGAINDSFIKVVQKGIETRMRLVTASFTYSG